MFWNKKTDEGPSTLPADELDMAPPLQATSGLAEDGTFDADPQAPIPSGVGPEPPPSSLLAKELDGPLAAVESRELPHPESQQGSADSALPARANSAQQLVKEKGRRLNLVNNGTLMPAIARSIAYALDAYLAEIDIETKKAIVHEARANLVATLKNSSKKVRGLPEQAFLKKVTAERDRIVSEREQAEEQLAGLMGQLEGKRNELHIRSQMIANESAAAGVMHDRLMSEQIRIAFEECAEDPDKLLERVTQIAMQSTEGERAKLVDVQVSEHQREIENFERRIAKLTQSLQMTEEEMRKIAAAKNIDLGVASIYRTVQGLDGSDAQNERKKELMSTLFEANLELKQAIDNALPE